MELPSFPPEMNRLYMMLGFGRFEIALPIRLPSGDNYIYEFDVQFGLEF